MLAALLVASVVHASGTTVVIEDVTVVQPGKTVVREHQTVVVENGVFTQVAPGDKARVPRGAKRINGSGKYLIPGLWDMHVHWYDEKSLGLFTANGVTGIRVMFGQPRHLEWREKVEKGALVGPRMVVGSPIVDGAVPMWQGSVPLKHDGETEALVSRLKVEGWDFIKVYSHISHEAFVRLAKDANDQRMPFAGHVPFAVGPLAAAKLGQRSMEHLGGLFDACAVSAPLLLEKLQEAMSKDTEPVQAINQMYETYGSKLDTRIDKTRASKLYVDLGRTKMWQCPTLTVLRALANLDQASFVSDPRLKYLPARVRDQWNPANDFRLKERKKEDWEGIRAETKLLFGEVLALKKSGNKFLAGTDCLNPYCFPGFSLHDELALLVECGFTPTEALEAATTNPARFFGQDRKWGTVDKGKRADAVLLDRNPLEDIHNTTSINCVMQGGRLFARADLDAILSANESSAN